MILLSVTNGGLSPSDYVYLSNIFMQVFVLCLTLLFVLFILNFKAYGYEKLVLLNKLQTLGLFEISDPPVKEEPKPNNSLNSSIKANIAKSNY